MSERDDLRPKGTNALIYFFFICFIAFYILNWKELVGVWNVG